MAHNVEDNLDLSLSSVLSIIHNRMMDRTTYFGVKTLRNPMDHWVYQEIIFQTRPDVIVEIGSWIGGGTLALAHMCDLLDGGRVIGIDVDQASVPESVRSHPRITLIEGDACLCFERVRELIADSEKVMVIEDSSHEYANTLNVLRTYAPLVEIGSYFIVEDSIGQHGIPLGPKPGPYEAIDTFVEENPCFEIDREMESFLITWNPKGYLRRIASDDGSRPEVVTPAAGKSMGSTLADIVRLVTPPILLRSAVQIRRKLKTRV